MKIAPGIQQWVYWYFQELENVKHIHKSAALRTITLLSILCVTVLRLCLWSRARIVLPFASKAVIFANVTQVTKVTSWPVLPLRCAFEMHIYQMSIVFDSMSTAEKTGKNLKWATSESLVSSEMFSFLIALQSKPQLDDWHGLLACATCSTMLLQ